jgi:hypothetical protein
MEENKVIKRCLLFLLLLLLFFPLVQNSLRLFEQQPLKGDFEAARDIEFSGEYWFSGVFQENKEKYLNENFGLRNTFVRLNNEVKFDLYKKTSNIETVVGKENELFAKAYIDSYTGKNFVGDSLLAKKAETIREIQALLKKQGKIFLPVLAPNKARCRKQLLPDGTAIVSPSNYEVLVKLFKQEGVSFLDFNDYFLKNAATSRYPLFSKYGVHWSSYGHALAADSLVKYISWDLGEKMPAPDWSDSFYLSDSLRELDYDAGEGMNLLRTLPSQPLAYAKYRFRDTSLPRPPVMVVGDSYNFGLELTGIYDTVFSKYMFLYYFNELRPIREDRDAFLKLNFSEELNSRRVFLLVTTEHNLINYGWGFLEKTLKVLKGVNEPLIDETEKQILLMMSQIRKTAKWYGDVVNGALLKKVDIDTELRAAARYAVNKKMNKGANPMEDMIFTIRSDPQWMEDVKERARRKKISVDSAIVLDALWQLQNH